MGLDNHLGKRQAEAHERAPSIAFEEKCEVLTDLLPLRVISAHDLFYPVGAPEWQDGRSTGKARWELESPESVDRKIQQWKTLILAGRSRQLRYLEGMLGVYSAKQIRFFKCSRENSSVYTQFDSIPVSGFEFAQRAEPIEGGRRLTVEVKRGTSVIDEIVYTQTDGYQASQQEEPWRSGSYWAMPRIDLYVDNNDYQFFVHNYLAIRERLQLLKERKSGGGFFDIHFDPVTHRLRFGDSEVDEMIERFRAPPPGYETRKSPPRPSGASFLA